MDSYKELMGKKGSRGVVLCSEAESAAGSRESVSANDDPTASANSRMKSGSDHQDAREEARRAARRLVNFGWKSQGVEEDRGVEAVQDGKVVESSFAKGEWGIRWASQ